MGVLMAKTATVLGALEVKRLTEPGMHPVGTVSGLRLNIKPSGSKSWILRTVVGINRKDIGLGGYPETTLAMAIEKARAAKDAIQKGIDPVAERRAAKVAIVWTFKVCALAYIDTHRPSWKNAKHAQQWTNTLETYVYPKCGDKHVKDIDTEDVLACVRPMWSQKNETMVRILNRIGLVLAWAAAQGYRDKGFNPATWRGHIDQVLPKPSKVNQRESFEAVPIDSINDFMRRLGAMGGTGARCLEFTILCACRSGESRGALWSEINLDTAVWTIPAARMKAGREHRVPLSLEALALLAKLPKFTDKMGRPIDLVFPGLSGDKALSDMTLTAIMRRMGLTAVPHGFRSTFTDWCAERTAYPAEVREMALAHAVGNKTEAAYRRGDLFEKRRQLMAEWARFVWTPPAVGNVVALRAA